MDASKMEQLVARLEAATVRLEGLGAGAPAAGSGSAAPVAQAAPVAAAAVASSGSEAAFASLIAGEVAALEAATAKVGDDDVTKSTKFLTDALRLEGGVVSAIAQCKAPAMAALQELLAPIAALMTAAADFERDRKNKAFHHTKVIAECTQGLTWLAYQPSCGMSLPAKTVEEAWNSAEFFANKLLKLYRPKPDGSNHVAWLGELKTLMKALQAYVKTHHPTGPAWNAQGTGDPIAIAAGATSASAGAPPPPPSAPAAGPPPPVAPPPPPPGSLTQPAAPKGGGGGGMSAVFGELTGKGDGVTSGLKKVTADMKSKNRKDKSGLVSAGPKPAGGAPPSRKGAASTEISRPPKFALEMNRWCVEHCVGRNDLIIEAPKMNQAVSVYKCKDCVVQVQGKVNAITLDGCTKVGVIFEDVVSSVETVNSTKLQLQAMGKVGSIAIDKTDGAMLYLNKACVGSVSIVVSKSSELNVLVPDGEDGDFKEIPLPEQFVSEWDDATKNFITKPAEHGAG